jgi:hypothetical protein
MLRLIADYKDEPVDSEQAAWVVEQASVFVEAMQAAFLRGEGDAHERLRGDEPGEGLILQPQALIAQLLRLIAQPRRVACPASAHDRPEQGGLRRSLSATRHPTRWG